MNYDEFLKNKITIAKPEGFAIDESEINPLLKPHQKASVRWAILGGKRALFEAFGMGKTVIALEIERIILAKIGGRGLIVCPLGVKQEFIRDAEMLNTGMGSRVTKKQRAELKAWQESHPNHLCVVKFIRSIEECGEAGIYLTNYETVRDGKLNPHHFRVAHLDEAACLRGFGGSKTFREFMAIFAGDRKSLNKREQGAEIKYRFVATATPSPNEYIELLAYSAFLGILDVSGAKTKFFKRDSVHADRLTLHKHKEKDFWLWVASWALFVSKPSDLGFSDKGYALPEMIVRWHEVKIDGDAGEDKRGQALMFRNAALGLSQAAKEKRESMDVRIEKMQELLSDSPDDHVIIWHDLEAERHAIKKAVPGAVSVYGSLDLESREQAIIDFSEGTFQYLSAKPSVAGSGCNFQYHCHRAIFMGIGFKFADFIQAVHRIQRFLQPNVVVIDLIYTEGESEVRRTLERKWQQHNVMVEKMTTIVKEYGLSEVAMASALMRKLGCERVEVSGENFTLVNNDCVPETKSMKENSVDLILTSIPFSTQYEYSPSFNDFGHTDNNQHFFEQMDYLIPELLRVLKPGRLAEIHVKDRIVPGGMTGLGFQTVYPFHIEVFNHFTKAGFAFMGMRTIVTDVVRENNQTYRLGWTEQCKDGSKMGTGMPEYLMRFRKPPTDASDGYADNPVVKQKDKYTRSRWQIDAHGLMRSSGNRLMDESELRELPHETIFKLFRDYSLHEVYDFEHHVKIGEVLEEARRLPVTFMLLQPASWHPDVWTDITRMLTLNGAQSAKGKEMHLCPMQFDLADRVIEQCSMPGEVVFDPFAGLGTVPYRAVLLGRRGLGCELAPNYFIDSVAYCKMAEYKMATPSLFDISDWTKNLTLIPSPDRSEPESEQMFEPEAEEIPVKKTRKKKAVTL